MKRLQVAVIGFGRVGRACAAAILEDEELALAGIVRRREQRGEHLEEEGHGVLLERQGIAVAAHQRFLLEARYSEPALCAAVMTAAARALPGCRHRAYSFMELPLGSLWGELQEKAKREWL